MILAGDIGGTSTRLALFNVSGKTLAAVAEAKYHSREHAGLDEIVKTFLAAQRCDRQSLGIAHAAFGIAGVVREGKVRTVNLPWVVDAQQLSAEIGGAEVHLLNDLEANAHGIPALGPNDLETLNAGRPDARGNAAVISAGTGLGEAGIYFDGRELHPFACEGGHTDFGPRDSLEAELLLHLKDKFVQGSAGHVSYERLVSGPGLQNIYEFLRDTGRGNETPEVTAAMRQEDPAAAISQAALSDSSSLCVQAVDIFVSLYGAEAGNLALKMMATRGVYVGGGIAPRIISKLKEPLFREAFCAKGRHRPLLELIPVRVIMNDQTALLGAARFAAIQAGLLAPWSG